MKPFSVPGPTGSPNCATFVKPGEPSTTRCTSSGRADRDVSGSRSLRTARYEMPWRARVSARPADGLPAANSRWTESRARIVADGVRGIESRTPHGLPPSTCSGSSWLLPHTWVANGAPGTTSTRPCSPGGPSCSSSQCRRVVPVLRDRGERAGRGEAPGPGQRRGHDERDQGDGARRRPACRVRDARTPAATPAAARCRVAGRGPAGARGRGPAAAGSAARACARCAAACRRRPGTPAPGGRTAIRDRPSSRRPAARGR